MSSFNTSLPLHRDDVDGIAQNKTITEAVRQNLINLLLTNPGERPMLPRFGVGLSTFLFEIDNASLRGTINSKIYEQVSLFMPFLEIVKINFISQLNDTTVDNNTLSINIIYNIKPLEYIDELSLSTDGDLIITNSEVVQDNNI